MSTAGHSWTEGPAGRVCACGRRWVDIAGVTKADIGQADIAHSGTLTAHEFTEIVTTREAQWIAGAGV